MILVLDVGTSVLKGALFEEDGTMLASGRRSLRIHREESRPLCLETDPAEWVRGIRALSEEFGLSQERKPAAVVVSGNGPSVFPIGDDDQPLYPAILWMDRRSTEEAAMIFDVSGFYIDPTFYLPKVLWFFRHRPEIYAETKYFLGCPEYINFLLTGVAATILPAADYEKYIWTQGLVSLLGMDWGKFPPFARPTERLGLTTAAGSRLLGVPQGVPVYVGGPDFLVSLVGTGTVAPGRACDRAGTSEGINLCTDQAISDPRLICVGHVIEGYRNVSGVISTSGRAIQWFKEITGRQSVSYDDLFAEIAAVPAGANKLVFLPYLAGERAPIWDSNARGAFVGLTMNHGRKEMTRAVVESVGFAIRDIITVMEEIGLRVEDVRVTGGQAKSAAGVQIRSDITGKRYLSPVLKDAELAGDLCIALYALGRYGSLAEAAESAVQIERVFEPTRAHRQVYDDLFAVYRESYTGLKEPFRRIGRIA